MSPIATNMTRVPDGFGVYPNGDTFNTLSGAVDLTYLVGNYVRFEPWNSQLNVDGTRFWGATQVLASNGCDIHNGCSGAVAFSTNPATVSHQSVVSDGSASGFIFRDYNATDVELKGNFRFRERPFVYTGTQGFALGLAARVNGTLTAGGSVNTRFTSVNGYYFGLFGEPSGGTLYVGSSRVRLMIIKVVSGVPTALNVNSTTPGSTAPNLSAFFPTNTNIDHVLRFTVQDVGGTVQLRGYRVNPVPDAQGQLVEELVCSADDSSSPITATGRAGIVMSGDNTSMSTPSGQRQAMQCNYWSVGPIGGAPVLYEGWRRFDRNGGKTVSAPGVPLSPGISFATSLRHGWTGDFSSTNATGTQAYEDSMRLDSANNRIYARPSLTGSTVYAFSQIVARDPKFQDRSVDVVMETGASSTSRTFGLILFGTSAGTTSDTVYTTPPRGYTATVDYIGSSGTFNVSIARLRGSVAPVVIATKTGVAGLALGTSFTLRFQALTLTSPTPQTGYIGMKVYINGTQQTWNLAAGFYDSAGNSVAAGSAQVAFSIDAAGTVTDRTSVRISEGGNGEGVVFLSSNHSTTANSYFDAWTAAAGGAAPDTPEEDQVTIAVPAENDAATGTFNYAYEFGHIEESRRPQLRHSFDSDHKYVALQTIRPRRRWKIGNNAATSAEASGLKTFYGLRKGVEVPFNWTTPTGSAVIVRFVQDSLDLEQVTPSVFRWAVELEEVLAE